MHQPDIEIYIKHATAEMLLAWLTKQFGEVELDQLNEENLSGSQLIKGFVGKQVPLVITPKAAGKAYTSVWFQSTDTPWKNDLECAESVASFFDLEVRCSAEGWTEEEGEDEEKWWCLYEGEKKLVRWG